MDLAKLEMFVRVAQLGSLSRAALHYDLGPSALSRQLAGDFPPRAAAGSLGHFSAALATLRHRRGGDGAFDPAAGRRLRHSPRRQRRLL